MAIAASEHIGVVVSPDRITPSELQARINRSAGIIMRNQQGPFSLFPAADADHCDFTNNYDRFWVRDGAIDAYYLLKAQTPEAQQSAQRALQGMFQLFTHDDFQRGFAMRPDDHGHITYLEPQKAPPVHRRINGEDVYWFGRNQPDSFGEVLIAIAELGKQNMTLSGRKEMFTSRQQDTLIQMVEYLLGLKIWKFACSSMWENEQVHSPPPLSTVAIVAKGLEEILPYLPEEFGAKIKPYVYQARQFIAGKNNAHPFPHEYTEQYHPSRYDLATLVAFDLGAFDYMPIEKYLEWRQGAKNELGYKGMIGLLRRFKHDPYYARRVDKQSINIGPMGDDIRQNSIADGGEALWFMSLAMDTKMLCKLAQQMQKQTQHIDQWIQEEILHHVQYMEDLYNWCNDTYPELFTPTFFNMEPPTMNNNDLLWNHAVVIGALQEFKKTLPFLVLAPAPNSISKPHSIV